MFIKLRLPSYVIAPRDIETPSMRATLERLLHDVHGARGMPAETPGATVVLRGSYDPQVIAELGDRLGDTELATRTAVGDSRALLARRHARSSRTIARMLVARLDSFADADSTEFLDALQRRRDVALDAALDVVRTSLHANVV